MSPQHTMNGNQVLNSMALVAPFEDRQTMEGFVGGGGAFTSEGKVWFSCWCGFAYFCLLMMLKAVHKQEVIS